MKIIARGAEADVYLTNIFGFKAILKDRKPKTYRVKELDEAIRTARTKSEAKATAISDSIGIRVPNILFVKRYSLYMSYIEGMQMSAVLRAKKKIGKRILSKIGKYLGILHANSIIHGDFTPANILIDNIDEPWVIDFGLASVSTSIEDKALDMLLMKRSLDASSYKAFISGYAEKSKDYNAVMLRLAEIEKRGRYNERA